MLGAWDHVAIVNTAALWLFICRKRQILFLLIDNNQITGSFLNRGCSLEVGAGWRGLLEVQ